MEEPPVKTRFAPSPTGRMHLGNLRTALFNVLMARGSGGRFLLRIEDTDRSRVTPESVDGLLQDLAWLGLDWDEGPDRSEPADGAYQSRRGAIYERYFQALKQAGTAYPCFCSEAELEKARRRQRAAGRPPRYPGTCARLSPDEAAERVRAGEPATLRFRVPSGRRVAFEDMVRGDQQFDTNDIGDFIIRRADGTAAFFFSNAVDDALMGVTHVLRGEDHLTNTPRQMLLLEALGLKAPRYGHITMIVGDDGAPLSKRHGSRSVAELRDAGYLPAAILNYLARLGHTLDTDALLDLEGLSAAFSPQRLGRAPARYDEAQLRHWQAEAVAAAPVSLLADWLLPGSVPEGSVERFVSVLRPNVRFPQELQEWAERLYGEMPVPAEEDLAVIREAGADFFASAGALLPRYSDDFKGFLDALKADTGCSGKRLFMPLRLALTGRRHGPELAAVAALLSQDRAVKRFDDARRLAGDNS
ncbi:MAG: glutamate--tRNA ligase [Ectothiorhodospiraceae bacterium]